MNILIVDDLLQNRKLLADLLRPYGQCDTVSDGFDAIDAFEGGVIDGNPYDLILLDIVMPEMNGQQVLQKMRVIEQENRVSKEAIIIMVTSLDSPRNVLDAFYQGGCDDYIVKPINQDELMKKLEIYNLI